MILRMTRDLGVNRAGVEVILSMREKMERMQREMDEMVRNMREEMAREMRRRDEDAKHALVPLGRKIPVRRGK